MAPPVDTPGESADPPSVTDTDTMIDNTFFDANPQRECYARVVPGGWVLVVKRVAHARQAPVMLRVWARGERVPEGDAACLKLWEAAVQGRG